MTAVVERLRTLRERIVEKQRADALVQASAHFEGTPHSSEGAQLLEEFCGCFDHPAALHHLAIHHHALAFSTEAEGDVPEQLYDEALRRWQVVCESESFWESVHARGAKYGGDRFDAALLTEVRSVLPRWLLEVHSAAVLRYRSSDPPRARAHMNILLGAPFERERLALRRSLYEHIASAAWEVLQSKEGDNHFEDAILLYGEYLSLDPNYPDANIDLLHVLNEKADVARLDGVSPNVRAVVDQATPVAARVPADTDGGGATLATHLGLRAYVALYCHGDVRGAREDLAKCLKLAPLDVVGSTVQRQLAKYEEVLQDCAEKKRRADLNGYLLKARLHRAFHQYDKAEIELNTVRNKLLGDRSNLAITDEELAEVRQARNEMNRKTGL